MPRARPIVFVGPSIPLEEARQILDAEFRSPCRRGDLARLPGGAVVGLIDGVFHHSDAVSPREIVYALERGVTVFGSSSMGALRAAEVPGIRGIGRIYEMYRRGAIENDDEVALLFDSVKHAPLTVPLVNVRYAVERLQSSGTITSSVSARILEAARTLHYTARTYPQILETAGLSERGDAEELLDLLNGFDLKRDDARLLLERLARAESGGAPRPVSAAQDGRLETPPDYGPADGFASVRMLDSAGSEAPVLVWEIGGTVPFSELVLFLKLTGGFDVHAGKAVTRLLLQQAPPALSEQAGTSLDELKAEFHRLCRTWGWRTEEEVRVTMTDLGLGFRDVLKELRDDALARRTAAGLARTADEAFLKALRCELFFDDLALKREVMRYGSLNALGEGVSLDPESEPAAKRVLCRMHGIAGWDRLRRRLSDLGITDGEVQRFLILLTNARTRAEAIQRASAQEVPSTAADGRFGLHASPKPAGEQRFSLPLAEAYEQATRMKRLIGVTRVGMITGLTDLEGIHVSQVARPAGVWSSSYGSGKSDTREGAIVGGVMEETEKWAQEQFKGECVWASYASLRESANTLDPRLLDLPYDSIYEGDLEFMWHECHDLIQGRPIWVPLAAVACSFNAGRNNILYSPRGARVTFSTNGLASGFTLADALVHATCEFIERHAVRMSELRVENPGLTDRRRWPRRIDPSTLQDATRLLVQRLERAACEVGIWDITSEVRVPTLLARVDRQGEVARGSAAHPRPGVAAHMALMEAMQTIVAAVAAGREDLTVQARSLGRHERSNPLRAAAHFFWKEADLLIPLSDLAGLATHDAYDEFAWVRCRLVDAGIRHLIAVDLTRDEMRPARAVRVILPGLETNNPYYCGPRARIALISDMVPCRV